MYQQAVAQLDELQRLSWTLRDRSCFWGHCMVKLPLASALLLLQKLHIRSMEKPDAG